MPASTFRMLEASPDATLVLDGTTNIIFANTRAASMFGVARAALEGALFDARLVPESRKWLRETLTAFLAPSPPQDADARRYLTGGPELHALRGESVAFPVEISLGRVAEDGLAVVVVRDLTEERRAANEKLVWLDALLECAPAFLIAVSPDGKVTYINRVMSQYRKSDVIGSSWLQYFAPEGHAPMEAALAAVVERGSTETYETETVGPDGNMLWFSSQIGPIQAGGKIVGAVLASQDITARKRAEAELSAARHMALLGTLSAGVAHEINTPIQFVGDSIQFLRRSTNDLLELITQLQVLRTAAERGMPIGDAVAAAANAEDEADLPYIRENLPSAFELCVDGLNRVATIVRSLKAFAHPTEKEMKAVDINQIVESTLTIAHGEYKYVADLTTNFGEIPLVTCRAGEISQAVLNIVINAAHTIGDVVANSDRKGLIEVRTQRAGDDVLISIHDSGNGIPEAIRGRIFDPFFTTKELGKGTGQGLAIVWAKLQEHGGGVTFETEIGKGTTFVLRLPIESHAPAAARA